MKVNFRAMKVLILSPHTDDAELGAGGTIIKLLQDGAKVRWVVFSSAEESLPKMFKKNQLREEFISVAKYLNLKSKDYFIHGYQVRKLHEKRQDILEVLVKEKNTFCPDLVIGPSINDLHQDHQIVANEMLRAFKNISSIISYELPWNQFQFNNQLFISLSKENLDKKINLLKKYKTQILLKRKYFKPELIEGLSRIRGVQSNNEYAESFEVIRWMIKT